MLVAQQGLWPPPRLNGVGKPGDEGYQHGRQMTWSEAFFDLVFVTDRLQVKGLLVSSLHIVETGHLHPERLAYIPPPLK